jgi:hypothetical protein
VIRVAAVLRPDRRVIFTGAVTEKVADTDLSKLNRLLSEDLAWPSGLARAGRTTEHRCDRLQATQPPTPVDFIWVMDESGSMSDNRLDVSKNAHYFFNRAVSDGLDFRMGVTNVCDPSGSYSQAVGKFCSRISTNVYDDGGTDRFILPGEQNVFVSCINNPPGYEAGLEYGLVNAEQAVKRHLPRVANRPDRIRPGAQVVLIVATDEVPQSLTGTLAGLPGAQKLCALDASTQSKLDARLKPFLDLFKGTTVSGARVDHFQVIGGVCPNGCMAAISHGYKELAAALNGEVHDICEKSLAPTLDKILDDIITAGPVLKPTGRPIATSLMVAVDGISLVRGPVQGFNYVPSVNSLSFPSTAIINKGSSVVVSYQRWK